MLALVGGLCIDSYVIPIKHSFFVNGTEKSKFLLSVIFVKAADSVSVPLQSQAAHYLT